MQKRSLIFLTLGLLITGITISGCAMNEKKSSYPDKPINLIVPFSAGGGADLQARALEKLAPKYLHQNFIINNKPGGGATIGFNELVTSPSDGYILGTIGTNLLLQPLLGETKYYYPTALEPIIQFSTTPLLLVINADQPWQTLDDLILHSKQQTNALKFGHAGIGNTTHIIGEIFAKESGISVQQVPFRGASESTAALLGDHVDFIIAGPGALTEQIKSGKIRALAVSGEKRLSNPALAQIPTFKELGYDIVLEEWYGIAAPKEIDPEIKDTLEKALAQMVNDPEFKTDVEQLGMEVSFLNSADLKKKLISDNETLKTMINKTDIIEQIQAQKK